MYLPCSVRPTDVFSVDYWHDLEAWVTGHSVIEKGNIRKTWCGFLFVFHTNYGPILYQFRDKAIYLSKIAILGVSYYITIALCCRNSVCLLSSVTFVQSTHMVELFSSISAPANTLWGLGQFVLKFRIEIQGVACSTCKLNKRRIKNWRFRPCWKVDSLSIAYSCFCTDFKNDKRYGHSYNGRRIRTHVRSMEWCYLQWSWVT